MMKASLESRLEGLEALLGPLAALVGSLEPTLDIEEALVGVEHARDPALGRLPELIHHPEVWRPVRRADAHLRHARTSARLLEIIDRRPVLHYDTAPHRVLVLHLRRAHHLLGRWQATSDGTPHQARIVRARHRLAGLLACGELSGLRQATARDLTHRALRAVRYDVVRKLGAWVNPV